MRTIEIGGIYMHFKGNEYKVLNIALHSETKQKYVVYQEMQGEKQVYVRPYEMFASEVDHNKYPEVKQKFRFELIRRAED